ncbi:Metalloproteinase inhibitor 3 [Mactra antiquata]
MATPTFIILCFATIVATSWACTCVPTTNIEIYCNADFVVRVEVFGSITQGMLRIYEVDITEILKSDRSSIPPGTEVNEQNVVTPIHSSLCGVMLQPGYTHLVAGRYKRHGNNYYMDTHACINFMQPVTFIPDPSLCYRGGKSGR